MRREHRDQPGADTPLTHYSMLAAVTGHKYGNLGFNSNRADKVAPLY
jgi:hypothetical protein